MFFPLCTRRISKSSISIPQCPSRVAKSSMFSSVNSPARILNFRLWRTSVIVPMPFQSKLMRRVCVASVCLNRPTNWFFNISNGEGGTNYQEFWSWVFWVVAVVLFGFCLFPLCSIIARVFFFRVVLILLLSIWCSSFSFRCRFSPSSSSSSFVQNIGLVRKVSPSSTRTKTTTSSRFHSNLVGFRTSDFQEPNIAQGAPQWKTYWLVNVVPHPIQIPAEWHSAIRGSNLRNGNSRNYEYWFVWGVY